MSYNLNSSLHVWHGTRVSYWVLTQGAVVTTQTRKLSILLLLSTLGLSSCLEFDSSSKLNSDTPENDGDVSTMSAVNNLKLTILHTNDHHGRFWKNEDGEYGMAARKTLIDGIRNQVNSENGCLYLLSGGDINTGVPESDIQKAVPDFLGMNLLGYDAMAVGNHEFDNPLETFWMQEDTANFPFLSANVYSAKTRECVEQNNCTDEKKRVVRPYIISEKCAGLKIGLLGLTTSDIRTTHQEEDKLEFKDSIQAAKEILPSLDSQTDLIIALTHMGHYSLPEEANKLGDIRLAKETSGIDVIVGGHSQEPLFQPDVQNGTIILQAHEWGKYVGRLDLNYNLTTRKLTIDNYKLIPVNLKEKNEEGNLVLIENQIPENQEMVDLLKPFQDRGQAELTVEIGSIDNALDGSRELVRNQPAPIAELINSALLVKSGADIAIFNGGGIRDSLRAGAISYRSTLVIHPFGNTLTTIELTTAELKDFMQNVVTMVQPNSGSYPHLKGITVKLDDAGMISEMKVNGTLADSTKTYKITLSSYMAGETYGTLIPNKHPSFYDTGYTLALTLRDYIEANTPLTTATYESVKSFIVE